MILQHRRIWRKRRGASVILVLFLLMVAFILAFAAIDMANLQREQVDDQIISDLASRFGANMTIVTSDTDRIQAQIDRIVDENVTFHNRLSYNPTFVTEYGSVDPHDLIFVPNAKPLNTVRVQVNSDVQPVGFVLGRPEKHKVIRDATAGAFHQDVCVVVDRSSSMCFLENKPNHYPDIVAGNPMMTFSDPRAQQRSDEWWENWAHPEVTRWARLIDALDAMADAMDASHQTELLSLVSYSHNHNFGFWDHTGTYVRFQIKAAETEADPTFDYQKAVNDLTVRYRNQRPVYGYTNITAGIQEGTKNLTSSSTRPNAFKTMVVMTDGQHNQGGHPSPAAEAAAAQGIRVIGITFGAGSDQQMMREVAAAGNGVHFHADNGVELEQIFRNVVSLPPSAFLD